MLATSTCCVFWCENIGGSTFVSHNIGSTSNVMTSTYAADFDGDGDKDVLSASYYDNKIAWYKNLGGGSFGTQQIITTNALLVSSVYSEDIDGDGDFDVLSASVADDKIAWYKNLGGGSFGPQVVISTSSDGANSVYAIDLDNDNDVDVLSSSYYDNKIAWYKNLGGGSFGTQQIITTNAMFASSVYSEDIDGDGDFDVLSASSIDDKIAWYENNTICYFNLDTTIICLGDSALIFGNYEVTQGIYYDSLVSFAGCDSVLAISLFTVSTLFSNQNISICQGDSILLEGAYQTSNGIYYDSLQTLNGCDSILSTTLTVNPLFSFNQNQSICQGDSLLIYDTYQNTAGIYYDSLQTVNGCDSILATMLTVNPIFTFNQNQSICQGDSILLYGAYQNTAGIYYDSLQTISGCDSVLSTTLSINPLPNVSITDFLLDTVCGNSGLVSLPIGSPSGGSYSGVGVSGGSFDPSTAGIGSHNVIYTFTDINSCINSDTTIIFVQLCTGVDNISNDFGILIYPNPNTGLFTIEKPSGLNKEVRVKLLDVISKLIFDKVIPIGQQKVDVDITNYSKGIYYLQLIIDKEIFVKQIIKN